MQYKQFQLSKYNKDLIKQYLDAVQSYQKNTNFENLIIKSQLLLNLEGIDQNVIKKINITIDNAKENHYYYSIRIEDDANTLIQNINNILSEANLQIKTK